MSPSAPRSLGHSGLTAGRLGLGCATFGREIPEEAAFALMDSAVANGITLFDTAEAYGGGQARAYRRDRLGIADVREVSDEMHSSEKIVGRWLRSRRARDHVLLVTKVTRDFRRASVRAALDASLTRLQTDRVDLYLCHAFDPATPPEETSAALDAVVRAGHARSAGCSNYNGDQLRDALALSERLGHRRFEVAELPLNLLQDAPAALPVARAHGLGVLAYSPLAAGFLTGKYGPDRGAIPKGTRFDVIPAHADLYFTERNFRRVTLLHALAARAGVSAQQFALAWVLQQPGVTTVLVGARNAAHLDSAIQAAHLAFDPAWLAEIATWP